MNSLTKRQTEVLQAVTRMGAIALHLQTGRTQTVIRNLIKKKMLVIAPDGRVIVQESRHREAS